MGGKCKQIDISTHTQTQTIFVYLSIEVKPSMAVLTPFHTSTNTIYLGWVLVSCWGAFFALNISCLLSVSVYLIESSLCLFTEIDKKNPNEFDFFFFNAVNFLYKNVPTLWSGQASVLMSFFIFLLLREKETPDWTGLMRGLRFTRWHIVCSCFLAVWPYWILRWDTSLGFQEKSVKFLGVSVLICHLLHWIGGTVLKTVRGKKKFNEANSKSLRLK